MPLTGPVNVGQTNSVSELSFLAFFQPAAFAEPGQFIASSWMCRLACVCLASCFVAENLESREFLSHELHVHYPQKCAKSAYCEQFRKK